MHDREFQGSNQVFYGNMRTLRQAGLDRSRHKDAVTENDMRKMYSSGVLGIDNPVSLQHKVYVEVALHFCRRGREGLRELTKNSFCEKVDSDGRSYITLGFNELEKNHQGLGKGDETEEPQMYEQGGENCPLKSFRTYLSKLHGGCEAFFQKPNVNYKKTGVWYVRCPVGKNSIANFMKVISDKAGLSRKYTNHCLRVTAISVLRRNGIDDSDIRSVSRHKTTDGIRPYCTGPPDKQRYRMSSMLHDHGHSGDSDMTVAIPERRPQPDSPVPSTSGLHLSRPASMSQANVTSSPVASTSDRQFGHETVSAADDDSELLAVSSSSSGGGRPGNTTMVVSSQSEQKMLKSIFAGAVFESGSAPVFNFNGNFNLFWVNSLRNVSM